MKGTTGIKLRRESAKRLLDAQLKRGTKREKINGKTTDNFILLTTGDITRINRELDTLNNQKNKNIKL
jgi:hypothetical protein